jgi:hypothetical protein
MQLRIVAPSLSPAVGASALAQPAPIYDVVIRNASCDPAAARLP